MRILQDAEKNWGHFLWLLTCPQKHLSDCHIVFYNFKLARIVSFYWKSPQYLMQNTKRHGLWEGVNNEDNNKDDVVQVGNNQASLGFLVLKMVRHPWRGFWLAGYMVLTVLVSRPMTSVKESTRTLRDRSQLSLSLEKCTVSLRWAWLMISSRLARCHTDVFKGFFFSHVKQLCDFPVRTHCCH